MAASCFQYLQTPGVYGRNYVNFSRNYQCKGNCTLRRSNVQIRHVPLVHGATFYSRSRSQLWTKGETSMNFINVHDVFLDCDRDSVIYLGKPDGPTCHTGAETCYYTSVFDSPGQEVEGSELAMTTLYSLESTISQRKAEISTSQGKPSWTKKLLLDSGLLCSKIREEADELCRTLEENEDQTRAASEMADVLYHSMVLLALKNVNMEEVLEILRKRFSKSGIEEKQSRKS